MNAPSGLAPVKILALARLLAASAKGETRAKVGADLKPLVEHRRDSASWADRLDRVLDECEAAGEVDRIRDKTGKPTAKLVLTDEGRRAALEALGVPELPARTTWPRLRSTLLPALALGHPGRDAATARYLSGAPGLRAEILRETFGLELAERPTAKAVAEATAAKLLGLESGRKFSKDEILAKLLRDAGLDLQGKKPTEVAIQEALFRRELGDGDAQDGKPLERLAARAVGAGGNKPADLTTAILKSWVDRSGGATATIDEIAPAASADRPAAPDLGEFARRVVEAARESPGGWFGNAKVFISHVRRALGDDPDFRGMDDASFKRRLVEAHRAHLLELGRADLVEAMDPADVSASATPYLNAVYHFVRTEEPAR